MNQKLLLGDLSRDMLRMTRDLLQLLDDLFSESLFIQATRYDGIELLNFDYNDYRYIFIVDIANPPDYEFNKWQTLASYLNPVRDKVFCIAPLGTIYPFKVLPLDWPFVWFVNKYLDYFTEHPRQNIKKYCTINGAPHQHRVDLVNSLKDKNLLESGYYSLSGVYSLPSETLSNASQGLYGTFDHEGFNHFPIELFHAPFHITTETSINNNFIYPSEKILKHIFSKAVPLVIGNPGVLSYLDRIYGIKDTSPFDYDFEKDYRVRINKFCSFIESTSLYQLSEYYKKVEDTLYKNKETYIANSMEIAVNNFLTYCDKNNILHL